jgi:MFS family permease
MTRQENKRALWKNSQFVRLWFGNLISALADGAFFVALSWFIVDVTGSETVLGTTLICMSIPRLLFMLAGGVAADRFSRKRIMVGSILARGMVLSGFGLLLLYDSGQLLPYSAYAMAALFGTVDAFFWPARSSILPFVVGRDQLAGANSLMEISQQLSMVGGPLVAALLLHAVPYPPMFLIMAAAFFAGTLLLFTLRLQPVQTEPAAEPDRPHASRPSYFRDVWEGIRFTFSIPILTIIFGTSLVLNMMFSGPVNMGLPLLVKQLGWDGSAYSSLSSALGVGTIAGGVITALCGGFRGRYTFLPLVVGLMGAGIAAVSLMHQLAFGLAMLFAVGMAMSMTNIPLITYIQAIVPAAKLGRVMSLLTLMSVGLGPVSYALCSVLLERRWAAPDTLLLVGGLALGTIGLSLLLFREFRRMEEHPLWSGRTAAETTDSPQPHQPGDGSRNENTPAAL